ncbi:LexA family protein [Sinorhizobium medicae]
MTDFAGSMSMGEICDNRDFKSSKIRDIRDINFRVSRENVRMKDRRQEIRDWLQTELDRKGYGAKGQLAKFLGLRNDGITRILNTAPGKEIREVKADELVKMGEFFGSTPPGLTGTLTRSEAPINSVKVIGRIAANTWMDVDEMDFGFDDIETVPSVGDYPAAWQFGLLISGNCLNKIASNGDRLVCLDLAKAGLDAQPDDLVIVERSKFSGQMIERTAKRLRQSAKGFELWPESNDPAHQDPIPLYEDGDDDIELRIVGKVLWILRKP